MKAFKGIGSQLVLSFAVAVCVAIILVSLGSIRITKTSINANTEVTSEQTLDNVQEGFTTYLKTLSQPVDLLTRKNEIKHLEDQGELDDNVKAIKDSLVASVKVTNGAELAFFTTKTGLRVDGWAEINPETGKTANKGGLTRGVNDTSKSWYQNCIGSKARNTIYSQFSDPYVDSSSGKTIFTVSQEIKYTDGANYGAVGLNIDFAEVEDYVKNIGLLNTGYVILVNKDGKILVDNDTNEIMKYKELVPMFHMMEEAAELLRKKRFARGSVDFDFPESKIILDENGHPTDIKPYDRNVATKIIEDFMLAANETVAEDYFWQDMPFLYRTHENPDPEKMRKLATFINNFGYTLRLTDDLRPKEIQKLLSEIEGSDAENLISRLTLRSMKKAKYTTECVGHFGLAAKYYCHFTSPIRRYPDLQIHRIIKENLHGGLSPKRAEHYDAILPDVAVQTSAMERRAADAERDTDKLKMAEYMEQFVGETFDGVVSGVTAWGVYVELPNTIEGMVSVNNMKGFYTFDEEHYEMVGELGNRSYKLGQKVKVVVIGTDKILRTIDFAFA